MAEAGDLLDHDQFSCPICLNLLKNPVTIPCGHSYCMDCIKSCWDQNDHVGVYSCPQCRQTFISRPVLGRNTMLAEVVEKLKKARLKVARPAHYYSESGKVMCDICTGRKRKAVKSCLVCLVSHCDTHLKLHNELHPGKRHKLIDATGELEEKVCSHHEKLLEVYCRSDQQCICYHCTLDKHRGHDTVSAAAGRKEKQKLMDVTQREFQKRIEEKEKELQELRQAVDSLTRSAQAAVEHNEKIFTEMICSIEKKRYEVKELIRAQEKAALSQAEGVLERLEQEIDELRRRDSELEQFSETEDHIYFLQTYQSFCTPPTSGFSSTAFVSHHCSFGDVKNAITDLKEKMEDFSKKKLMEISQKVKKETILHAEPRTTAEFIAGAVAALPRWVWPLTTALPKLGRPMTAALPKWAGPVTASLPSWLAPTVTAPHRREENEEEAQSGT